MVRAVKGALMKDNDQHNTDSSIWSGFAVPGQVFGYIVGGAGLGLLIGHFIDVALNSSPVATFLGLLLGLAVGIFGVYRMVTSLK